MLFRYGNRTISIHVGCHHRAVTDNEALGTAEVITDAAVKRKITGLVAQLGIGCVGIEIEPVAATAAIAEECRAIGGQPAVSDFAQRIRSADEGCVSHIEKRCIVASRFEQIRRPRPVHIDRLPRLVEADGKVELAIAKIGLMAQPQIIGDVVEAVELRIEEHDSDGVDRRGVGDLDPGIRPGGVEQCRSSQRRPCNRRRADCVARDVGNGVGKCLAGIRSRGERRIEAPRVVGVAEFVVDSPAVGHLELAFKAECLGQRMHPVADIVGLAVVIAVQRQRTREIDAVDRVAIGTEARQCLIVRAGVAAHHADRAGQIANGTVVEIFEVQPDEAAVERLGNAALYLAAFVTVVTGATRPFADPVETADMKEQTVRETCAIICIEAIVAIVEPCGRLDRAALLLASLRDQIDDPARRVRRERRRGAAAHRFDARDIEIGSQENVGIAERDVTEFQHGQAVFLKLQELGTAS